MAIEFNPQDDMGDRDEVAVGKAHAVMSEFIEFGQSKSNSHIAKFEIVAHDNPDEIGKIHQEFFSSKPGASFRLRALAVALGITTVDQIDLAKEAGQYVTLDFPAAQGRQLFITLVEEEYNNRKSIKIGPRDMYHLTDPKVKNHPRSEGMLKTSGIPLDKIPKAAANGTAPPAANRPAPPQQKVAAPAAAAPADELFNF